MFRIICNPFKNEFMSLCASASQQISLCAPYVKLDVIQDVFNAKNNETGIELITKISMDSFYRKSSDIGAIEQIILSNNPVYNVSNLHAKIYIFDDSACFISSANLTYSGLDKNYEYGIFTDEVWIVQRVCEDYLALKNGPDTGIIKAQIVKQIQEILSELPHFEHIKYPKLNLQAEECRQAVTANLSGQRLLLFNALDTFDGEEFDSAFAKQLSKQLPIGGNTPEATVRRLLQELRDIGLIQFVSPGHYAKLWR